MGIKVYLNSISLVAPGLYGWKQSLSVLSGKAPYIKTELPKLVPAILPANERRRTTPVIKLALHAAEVCIGENLELAQEYATVFASSDGDLGIMDKICRALNMPEHPVSPTNFHNSVHNAPAGYWAIAGKAQYSSNSLSGADETFAVGMIEAATYAAIENKKVLFVSYDYPAPASIDSVRHFDSPFAVAMCLSAEKQNNSLAELEIEMAQSNEYSLCDSAELEQLRLDNPAARSLPLLQMLAKNQTGSVIIPHLQSTCLSISINVG